MINFWTLLVVIISSLIKGITGYGFALLSLPVLLLWYSPGEIIPVLLICNLFASLFIVAQKKDHRLIDNRSRVLIVTGGVFTILGVFALSVVRGNTLMHISGAFFIVLTVLSLKSKLYRHIKLPKYSYLIAGAVVGFLTGTISVSGPPLALFLNVAKVSKKEFREIFANFSIVTALVAVAGYYRVGLFTTETIKMSLIFTPVLFIGTMIGKQFNSLIPATKFRTLNVILTIISSVLLIVI